MLLTKKSPKNVINVIYGNSSDGIATIVVFNVTPARDSDEATTWVQVLGNL